jgi:hypothetical protein
LQQGFFENLFHVYGRIFGYFAQMPGSLEKITKQIFRVPVISARFYEKTRPNKFGNPFQLASSGFQVAAYDPKIVLGNFLCSLKYDFG